YSVFSCFLFTASSTTEFYTLSLHDALPIWMYAERAGYQFGQKVREAFRTFLETLFQAASLTIDTVRTFFLIVLALLGPVAFAFSDRKSTRLNSSHVSISYAVFCLKKKKRQ